MHENLSDEELLKLCKPLFLHASYPHLLQLLKRKQAAQTKRAMSLPDPVEIYRCQGRVHALDEVISLHTRAEK